MFNKFVTRTTSSLMMAALLLLSTSCHKILDDILDDVNDDDDLPETVVIDQEGLFPEGVEFYEKGHFFLVSSLTQGSIGKVADDSQFSPFIQNDDFVSTIGIHVDDYTDRLLICNSNPNQGNLAELYAYRLSDQHELFSVTLSELFAPDQPHFANDVAVDKYSNAYVTDSFSPYIYKVDPQGHAEVLLNDDAFTTEPGAFGFNGIVYHPDDYLIVAFSATNSLYKVPLDDPHDYQEVALEVELAGPDGLYLSDDNETLIVVNNAGGVASGKVLALESEDEWNSAHLEGQFTTGLVFPTTAVQREDKYYVLYAYLNELFSGNTVSEYQIKQVDFKH